MREYLFPIEEGPQLPVRPLYIPMFIPKGYWYQGGSLDTEGVVTIRIANRSEEITFIQAPHWGDPGLGPVTGPRVIQSGNRMFLCSENASVHQLFWQYDAHDYYLIGGQGCEELLKMAESIAPLDYDTLDCISYTPANPQDPFPDPERIRLIMPRSWMNARYPDKYHSQMYDITLTSAEFNASFTPDPRDSTILRHVEVKEDETVVYLSLPAGLFDEFSREQGLVRIRYPKNYFVSFTDMKSLYEAHFKDPAPPGWKERNPGYNSSKCVS